MIWSKRIYHSLQPAMTCQNHRTEYVVTFVEKLVNWDFATGHFEYAVHRGIGAFSAARCPGKRP